MEGGIVVYGESGVPPVVEKKNMSVYQLEVGHASWRAVMRHFCHWMHIIRTHRVLQWRCVKIKRVDRAVVVGFAVPSSVHV